MCWERAHLRSIGVAVLVHSVVVVLSLSDSP